MADTISLLKAVVKTWVDMNPNGDMSTIIDLQQSVYDLIEQNHVQAERIRQLEDALNRHEDLVRHEGQYFLKEDAGEIGPICPVCYQDHGIVSMLMPTTYPVIGSIHFCPRCEGKYTKPDNTVAAWGNEA